MISLGNEHDKDIIFVCYRNVVKSFYTAGMLFDVLSVFDEVSEDVSMVDLTGSPGLLHIFILFNMMINYIELY